MFVRQLYYVLALSAAICLPFAVAVPTSANVVLTSTANYTQNFNNLESDNSVDNISWVNNQGSTDTHGMPGWYWERDAAGFTYDTSSGSSTSASPYSFGIASVNGPVTDRAMGNMGGNGRSTSWGVVFTNSIGQDINAITVTYTGEEWRRNTSTDDKISFSYRTQSTDFTTLSPAGGATPGGWTSVATLDFTPPDNSGGGTSLDGNAPENRTQKTATIFVNVPAGQYLALRWFDTDSTGNDIASGIDDLTISVSVPEPSAFLFGGVVWGAIGMVATGRKLWRKVKHAA